MAAPDSSDLMPPPQRTPADIPAHAGRHLRGPGIGRIAAFFGLLAIAILGFDRLVTSGLRKIDTSKFGSFNRVVDGAVNADIVVNGSSRALTQYDARILRDVTGMSAYTVGINGVQTDVQCAVLKTYLRQNRKPKLVIQNLEVFTFEATRPGAIYDPGFFVPYLDQDDLYQGLRRIDPSVWKWKYIPLYGYIVEDMRFTWVSGLMAHLKRSGTEDFHLGFNPRFVEWTGEFERFKASVPHGVSYRIDPRAVQALEEILATCREQQIPVLLVYSPEYREMQLLERNRAEIFSLFRELASRNGATFWDYSDSALCVTRDNFYNSQHLNARGASLFSHDLANQLVSTGILHASSASRSRSGARND